MEAKCVLQTHSVTSDDASAAHPGQQLHTWTWLDLPPMNGKAGHWLRSS